MQREITVTVAVNDFHHAELIMKAIVQVVKERTTIYYVSDHKSPTLSVSQQWEKDNDPARASRILTC